MEIICYSGFSKMINSTKQPSDGTSKTVTLKQPTSVLNPTFLISDYDLSCNYIQWGSRYYYVDDIVIVHNNLAEYHCSTDVMATYKTDIGESSQYVIRSSYASDSYIQDTLYPSKASVTVSETELSELGWSSESSLGTYILGVLSENSSGGAVTYYSVGPGNFPSLMAKLFDPTYLSATEISVDLQKELVNPMQYIVSCNWFPFVYDEGEFVTVKFGWWDSEVDAFLLSTSERIYGIDQSFTLPVHPQNARGIYLNDAPYTRHTLHCYTFGSIPLDPAPFVTNNSGHIYIDVDMFTGLGKLYIENDEDDENDESIIHTQVAQIGVPIQLSQTTANLIGSGVATLEALGSAKAGNILGATHGLMSAVSSAMPQVQVQGANGSIVAYTQSPTIVTEFRQIADEDNSQYGRPLCSVSTVSSLPGFMICEKANLDTNASPSEKETILSNLNGGFYYE